MISSNLEQVNADLAHLKRSNAKFICINDDTDADREDENILVRSALKDYYESILPVASSFELPMNKTNDM